MVYEKGDQGIPRQGMHFPLTSPLTLNLTIRHKSFEIERLNNFWSGVLREGTNEVLVVDI